jgi:hypothetical protein
LINFNKSYIICNTLPEDNKLKGVQMKNRRFLLISVGVISILLMGACAPVAEPEAPVEEVIEAPVESPPMNAEVLGDCYNPFNPVIEGRTWTYRIQTSDSTDEYSISYGNVTESSFTSTMAFPDVTSTIQWSCSPEGLLSSDFGSLNITQLENVEIETIDVSGVVFPNAENWRVGYSWDLAFNVNITLSIEGNSLESQGTIAMANTIGAIEPVSVPAGDYSEAYRVDVSGTYTISVFGVNTEIPITYSNWFVKDVGMVKSSSADPEFGYTTELIMFE